jgi:hypothetical protein
MIQDLSKTLKRILTQPGLPPPLSNALILFDRPEQSFKPQQTAVDLFLYDLRENLDINIKTLEFTLTIANSPAGTESFPNPHAVRGCCMNSLAMLNDWTTFCRLAGLAPHNTAANTVDRLLEDLEQQMRWGIANDR